LISKINLSFTVLWSKEMALKPIDNALPLPHETAKFGVNEESKIASLPPPPADPIIDYISSENLEPISDPESEIQASHSFLDLSLFLDPYPDAISF
jgi:hypothetical protein